MGGKGPMDFIDIKERCSMSLAIKRVHLTGALFLFLPGNGIYHD
jgi:hypothetical protein